MLTAGRHEWKSDFVKPGLIAWVIESPWYHELACVEAALSVLMT